MSVDPMEGLWRAYKADPRLDLRNRLIEHYLPFVRKTARALKVPRCVEVDDLVASGTVGLIRAIDRFQVDRGIKFESFAQLSIRGAMLDDLRARDWVPRPVRGRIGRLRKATRAFQIRTGRCPSDEELTEQLHVGLAELELMRQESLTAITRSLHTLEQDSDDENCLLNILDDQTAASASGQMEFEEFLRDLLRGLNARERTILLRYYRDGQTLVDIGTEVGLTQGRVSQIRMAIVGRLQQRLGLAGERWTRHGTPRAERSRR